MFTGTASVVVRLPQAVWQVGRSIVTDEERDASGVVSVVGVGRMAGEVTGDSAAWACVTPVRWSPCCSVCWRR